MKPIASVCGIGRAYTRIHIRIVSDKSHMEHTRDVVLQQQLLA